MTTIKNLKRTYLSRVVASLSIVGLVLTSVPTGAMAELGQVEEISSSQKRSEPNRAAAVTPENYQPKPWELVEPTISAEERQAIREREEKAKPTEDPSVSPELQVEGAAALQERSFETLESTDEPVGSRFDSTDALGGLALPEVSEPTGAMTYTYPLALPPGRGNITPAFALGYNSQNRDEDSILGYGWSFGIPRIQRVSEAGNLSIFEVNRFTSSLDGELVWLGENVGDGNHYAAKTENGSFNKYHFDGLTQTWTVTDKAGTTYTFGDTTESRQDNPSEPSEVHGWFLKQIRDTNGNSVIYNYYKRAGQIYPLSISYTHHAAAPGIFEVQFSREDIPSTGPQFDTGFSVETVERINDVSIFVDGDKEYGYRIEYLGTNYNNRGLIERITPYAPDGLGGEVTLPDTTFAYRSVEQEAFDSSDEADGPSFGGSKDNGVRMMVVNGDSLLDYVQGTGHSWEPQNRRVYRNTGEGADWERDDSTFVPVVFNLGWQSNHEDADSGARLGDVNGDSYDDIVQASLYEGESTRTVYLGNGDGTWTIDENYQVPVDFVEINIDRFGFYESSTDFGARLVDVNSDGLADIVRAVWNEDMNVRDVYLNRGDGTGWESEPSQTFPLYFVRYDMQNYGAGIRLLDMNNDGMLDIVFSYTDHNSPREADTWFGNGRGGWLGVHDLELPVSLATHHLEEPTGVRLVDINGDNLPDVVQSVQYYSSIGEPLDHVTKVWLNTGRDLVHDPDYVLPDEPFANIGWVVEGENPDARSWDVDADGNSEIYFGGEDRIYYDNTNTSVDLVETITHQTGAITTATYEAVALMEDNLGEPENPEVPFTVDLVTSIEHYDGMSNTARSEYSYSGGQLFYGDPSEREFAGFHKITRDDIATGRKTVSYYHQGNEDDESTSEDSDARAKIGRPYRVLVSDSSDHPFLLTITDWDQSALEVDQGEERYFVYPEVVVSFDYDSTNAASYKARATLSTFDTENGNLLEHLEYGEVSADPSDGSFTDIGTDSRKTVVNYALDTIGNVRGLPSEQALYDHFGSKVSESRTYYDDKPLGQVSKGNPTTEEAWLDEESRYIASQASYNTLGLVTTETNPRGKVTSYQYELFELYPEVVSNHLSHETTYAYDYRTGQVKRQTDANSLVTEVVFDEFGRLVQSKQSNQDHTDLMITQTRSYDDDVMPRLVHTTNYHTEGVEPSHVYHYRNGLGNVIQERSTGESGKFNVLTTHFDASGRAYKAFLPIESSAHTYADTSQPDHQSTITNYDVLDRHISLTTAVGVTTMTYGPWQTITIDPRLNPVTHHSDAFGRLVQVDERNDASTYTTSYGYDANDNLVNIVDAEDNSRSFNYDSLSRITSMELLHRESAAPSVYQYSYDDNGNLLTEDKSGLVVVYSYEDLDRVMTKDDPLTPETEVLYSYDTAPNGIGQLASVDTSRGDSLDYEYDGLGNVSKEARNFSDVLGVTEYSYDNLGQLKTITYPDSSYLSRHINLAGRVSALDNDDGPLVTSITYTPHGAVQEMEYANGSKDIDNYDIDQNYRLVRKRVLDPEGAALVDRAYTIDSADNITDIVDTGFEMPSVKHFVYDDLNRLTLAEITPDGEGLISAEYSYSETGNIQTANRDSVLSLYEYNDDKHPHATTKITTDSSEQVLVYNERGDLTESSSDERTDRYGYDFDSRLATYTRESSDSPTPTTTPTQTVYEDAEDGEILGWEVSDNNPEGATIENVLDEEKGRVIELSGDRTKNAYRKKLDNGNNWNNRTEFTISWAHRYEENVFIQVKVLTYDDEARWVQYRSNKPEGCYIQGRSVICGIPDSTGGTWQTFEKDLQADISTVYPDAILTEVDFVQVRGSGRIDDIMLSGEVTTGLPTQTVYEDAEDGEIFGWDIFDNDPEGATIENVLDEEKGRVIEFTGDITRNGYRKRLDNDRNWDNITEFYVSWSQKYDENVFVHLRVTTNDDAVRWVQYRSNKPEGCYESGKSIICGIPGSTDGSWQTLEKDLQADIASVHPDSVITEVDFIRFKGSGRVDDIVLHNGIGETITETYTYHYLDSTERIGKSDAEGVLHTYFGDLAEVDRAGNRTNYYFANGVRVAVEDPSGLHYNHQDHLSSASLLTDTVGAVVQKLDYYPYGSERVNEQIGEFTSRYTYTDQESDGESGLQYYNARYYNSAIGRFITQDPVIQNIGIDRRTSQALRDPQLLNAYSYVRNNSLKYTDESGEWFKEVISGQQSMSDFQVELGQAAQHLSESNAIWNTAIDHPYISGAIVGVLGATSAHIGANGLTTLSIQYMGGTGVACVIFCSTTGQEALRYADTLNKVATNPSVRNMVSSLYKPSDTIRGGTFGAVRNELVTGSLTNGRSHLTKAYETLNRISNIVGKGDLSQGDIGVIQTVLTNAARELSKAATQITKLIK